MKLYYQFCNCSNKKTETKKLCEILKSKIVIFLFLLSVVIDIVLIVLSKITHDTISERTCEHTNEYKEVHSNCINLKKNIHYATELERFPAPGISIHASKITKALEELFEQQSEHFQELRAEQETCLINLIENQSKEKTEIFYIVIGLDVVAFSTAYIWMCLPLGIAYDRNDQQFPELGWPFVSFLSFMITMLFKILSFVAIGLVYDLLKGDSIGKLLLNC